VEGQILTVIVRFSIKTFRIIAKFTNQNMKNTITIFDHYVKTKHSVSARETVSVGCADTRVFPVPQMGTEEVVGNSSVSDTPAEGVVDSAATTQFVSDANVVSVTKNFRTSVPRDLFDLNSQNNVMGITQFLEKPYLLTNGTLATTDTVATFSQFILPNSALVATIYRNKIEGYLGFRATMNIRFIMNGNPFQQGRYMLTYVPLGGSKVDVNSLASISSHTFSLVQRTQLNRIEMDVNCDTEGKMVIPFDSALNYFPFASLSDANQYGSWGAMQIYPYSTLVAPSGTTTVPYAVYVNFTEVELVGAAIPQMGTRGIVASVSESRAAGIGPVSSVLGAIATASRALVEIPLISSYAANTAWAADILGKTAKAFGFSKPSNLGHNTRTSYQSAAFIGNVDGFDTGFSIAASSENLVKTIAGLGSTDADEMSFKYIASIPAWFNTLTWTTSNSANYNLYTGYVNPSIYLTTQTITAQSVISFTPVAYVASHFKYWRGSIIYKFKFIKTGFHSGRLSFAFSPNEPKSSVTGPGPVTAAFLHRHIVDIRECNEVTIEVPYVSSSPYLEYGTSIGELYILVIDPLIAVGTVSSTVTILMEVSAGADFEVAAPIGSNLGNACWGLIPQMGANECELINTTIGMTSAHPQNTILAEICMGEQINSFRQLLKIFRPLGNSQNVVAALIENIIPFAMPICYYTGAAWVLCYEGADLYSELGSCFLYHRGGVRLKKFFAASNTYITYCSSATGTTSQPAIIGRGTSDPNGTNYLGYALTAGRYILNDAAREKVAEFTVPQYHPKHSRVKHNVNINPTLQYSLGDVTQSSGVCVSTFQLQNGQWTSGGTFACSNFRAGADDIQFGSFISVPPFVFSVINYYS